MGLIHADNIRLNLLEAEQRSSYYGRKDAAGSGSRRAGEAPGWHVRMFDTVPARRADTLNTRRLVIERDAAAEALFSLGSRKPHKYYW